MVSDIPAGDGKIDNLFLQCIKGIMDHVSCFNHFKSHRQLSEVITSALKRVSKGFFRFSSFHLGKLKLYMVIIFFTKDRPKIV